MQTSDLVPTAVSDNPQDLQADATGPADRALVELAWPLVVDLQDQLLAASTDMERLTGLLDDAAGQLLNEFGAAQGHLTRATAGLADPRQREASEQVLIDALRGHLGTAVTALQFHDMATQLIHHSVKRVRAVADYLGGQVMPEDGSGAAVEFVTRACPVAQRGVDAGSVELF
jgi:hypothetical protein